MDFHSLSRRQLQALSKKNKIPANITNVAMADALTALQFVEGIEEIMNCSESEIPQSPMVQPTGGRTRTAKVVGTPAAAPTTAARRRAVAVSTSVRRNIEASSEESLNEIEDVKTGVSMNTPAAAPVSRRRAVRETSTVMHAYSTRRSARLAEKIEEPKERSGAIKMNSLTEEIDENVEVEMKETSVENSGISEITVLDNFKECSEESEVKSNDEPKATSEEKVEIPNGDVAIASIDDIRTGTVQEEDVLVDGSMKEDDVEVAKEALDDKEAVESELVQEANVSEDVCEVETEGLIDDTEMSCNVDEETKASPEDTEMSFNVNEEDKASFEVTEMKSNLGDETKASIEDTDMNSTVDEDIAVAEFKVADSSNVNEQQFNHDEQNKEHESYAKELENDGHMIANDDESMSDDIFVPNHDELVSSIEPLKNSLSETQLEKSAEKPPTAVGRLTQVSDDKENVDNIKELVILKAEKPKKKALEDMSLRELEKMFREKMTISKQQEKKGDKEEDVDATTTRPALKTLSENCMLVQSQN